MPRITSATRRVSLPCFVAAILLCSARAAAQPKAAGTTDSAGPDLTVAAHGEVRLRSEWDRAASGAAADAFTLMRTRLGVRISESTVTHLLLEAQDSRVLGDARGTARQTFDLHQGFLEFTPRLPSAVLRFRAGRQEIALGNERLVGAVGWSNTGRSFDAVRLSVHQHASPASAARWTTDVLIATVEERGRHFGANTTSPTQDHTLGGVFVTARIPATSARVELTALADVGGEYRSYRDANRETVDLRIRDVRVGTLRAEFEGAIQRGHQAVLVADTRSRQSVDAWLAGVRLATSPSVWRAGTVTVGADLLSGDASPVDGVYRTFNTLYGTNHGFYGTIDVFLDPAAATRERGLHDLFASATMRVTDAMRLRVDVHHMRAATGANRDLGWEADLLAPIRIGDQATIDVGYSAFRGSAGGTALGLGAEGSMRHWLYVQMRSAFQR